MFKLQEKSNLSTKKIKQLYALPHGRKFKEKKKFYVFQNQFLSTKQYFFLIFFHFQNFDYYFIGLLKEKFRFYFKNRPKILF